MLFFKIQLQYIYKTVSHFFVTKIFDSWLPCTRTVIVNYYIFYTVQIHVISSVIWHRTRSNTVHVFSKQIYCSEGFASWTDIFFRSLIRLVRVVIGSSSSYSMIRIHSLTENDLRFDIF